MKETIEFVGVLSGVEDYHGANDNINQPRINTGCDNGSEWFGGADQVPASNSLLALQSFVFSLCGLWIVAFISEKTG